MNDRYLYRAKRIDNGEWVEGFLFQLCYDSIFCWCIGNEPLSPNDYSELCGFNREWFYIDESTICQCTGLKDKNGKKIWENDILMCHGNPDDLVKAVFGEFRVIDIITEQAVDTAIGWHYEVVPTDAISRCEPFCYPMPLNHQYVKRCEMKVIGNIYDNPELLGGTK